MKMTPMFPAQEPPTKKPRVDVDALSDHTIDTSSSSPDPLAVIEGLQVHDLSLLIYTKYRFVHM